MLSFNYKTTSPPIEYSPQIDRLLCVASSQGTERAGAADATPGAAVAPDRQGSAVLLTDRETAAVGDRRPGGFKKERHLCHSGHRMVSRVGYRNTFEECRLWE